MTENVKDNLLMKTDTWELRKTAVARWCLPCLNSYITHPCPTGGVYYWWNLSIINNACVGCNQYPPADMMGLWKLHNFDYIQAGV